MASIQDYVSKPNITYGNAAPITPDDDNDLTDIAQQIYVGGAGALHVMTANGQEVTFPAIAAGTLLPIQIVRVYEDSVASNLIALW